MRRIDVIGIGIGVFAIGGVVYWVLRASGLDGMSAGIWSQVIFTGALVGWLLTYLLRALTKTMTYNQQLRDYEDAVLQKRLDEMSPEEIAQLQAEIEAENQASAASNESTGPRSQ